VIEDTKSVRLLRQEVSLIKSCFPLVVLIIFAAVSVVALHGLARNLAQKRDFYSDPLCKVFWKKYQTRKNTSQARTWGNSERNQKERFSEKREGYRESYRITTEHFSTTKRIKTNNGKTVTLAPIKSGSMILSRLPHLGMGDSNKAYISASA
jgi:hypothetical protein